MAECSSGCGCGSAQKINLLYACSGAANTGYLADQVARSLMKKGLGKMTCLAGVGAQLSGFLESAKAADLNLVIDGCPVACGKKAFEQMGIANFHSVILTDRGVEKGKTEITPQLIEDMAGGLVF